MWTYLNLKYEGENQQRLHQLARDLIEVANLKNLGIDAKVIKLQSLNRSIANQKPEMELCDVSY